MPRGRSAGPLYEELNFTLFRQDRRYRALCNVCNKYFRNTAAYRLKVHRQNCKDNKRNEIVPTAFPVSTTKSEEYELVPVTNNSVNNWLNVTPPESHDRSILSESMLSKSTSIENMEFDDYTVEITLDEIPDDLNTECETVKLNQLQLKSNFTNLPSSTSQAFQPLKVKREPSQKKQITTEMVDSTTLITEAICNFFYGCNIPFSTIESIHFKELIRVLCPYYYSKLPKSEEFAQNLLDASFERCMKNLTVNSKIFENSQSVLIIGCWKNEAAVSKIIVSSIQSSLGSKLFLNLWDFDSEDNIDLYQIVKDSLELAENKYRALIYAIVYEDPVKFDFLNSDKSEDLWLINCNSHLSTSFAKDVSDNDLTIQVKNILKEFKHENSEEFFTNASMTPYLTTCCSNIDFYENFLKNIEYMRALINDEEFSIKINPLVKQLLMDDEFICSVQDSFDLFNPIFEIINYSRKENVTLAEVTHLWLSLRMPESEKLQCYATRFNYWKRKALNKYAIAAYFLHPKFHNELVYASKSADGEQNEIYIILQNFIIHHLDSSGISGFCQYESKDTIFGKLFEKKISEPGLFWKLVLPHYRNLASLALKLMELPASSAQLDGVLTQGSFGYSFKSNRMRFRKLMHMYFLMRMNGKKCIP